MAQLTQEGFKKTLDEYNRQYDKLLQEQDSCMTALEFHNSSVSSKMLFVNSTLSEIDIIRREIQKLLTQLTSIHENLQSKLEDIRTLKALGPPPLYHQLAPPPSSLPIPQFLPSHLIPQPPPLSVPVATPAQEFQPNPLMTVTTYCTVAPSQVLLPAMDIHQICSQRGGTFTEQTLSQKGLSHDPVFKMKFISSFRNEQSPDRQFRCLRLIITLEGKNKKDTKSLAAAYMLGWIETQNPFQGQRLLRSGDVELNPGPTNWDRANAIMIYLFMACADILTFFLQGVTNGSVDVILAFIYIFDRRHRTPRHFCIIIAWFMISCLWGYLTTTASKLLIQALLHRAGVEQNPGPPIVVPDESLVYKQEADTRPGKLVQDTKLLQKYHKVCRENSDALTRSGFSGFLSRDLHGLETYFTSMHYLPSAEDVVQNPFREFDEPEVIRHIEHSGLVTNEKQGPTEALIRHLLHRFIDGHALPDLYIIKRVNADYYRIHQKPLTEYCTPKQVSLRPGDKIRRYLVKHYARLHDDPMSAVTKTMLTYKQQSLFGNVTERVQHYITDAGGSIIANSVSDGVKKLWTDLKSHISALWESSINHLKTPKSLFTSFVVAFVVGAFGYVGLKKFWPYIFPASRYRQQEERQDYIAEGLFFETSSNLFSSWCDTLGVTLKTGWNDLAHNEFMQSTIKLGNFVKALENIAGFFQKISELFLMFVDKMWKWTTTKYLFKSSQEAESWTKEIQSLVETVKLSSTPDMSHDAKVAFVKAFAQLVIKLPTIKQLDQGLYQSALYAISSGQAVYDKLFSSVKFDIDRQEPVLLWIQGGAGCGKTNLLYHLYPALHAVIRQKNQDAFKDINQETFNSTLVYPRKQAQEFWDRYDGQWICEHDDLLQSKQVEDLSAEALSLIYEKNTCSYPLHMAEIKAKAETLFTSKFIVCTTNRTDDQLTDIGITEPKALLRRRDFVLQLSRKPASQCNKSKMYDIQCVDNLIFKLFRSPNEEPFIPLPCFEGQGADGFFGLVELIADQYITNFEAHGARKTRDPHIYASLYEDWLETGTYPTDLPKPTPLHVVPDSLFPRDPLYYKKKKPLPPMPKKTWVAKKEDIGTGVNVDGPENLIDPDKDNDSEDDDADANPFAQEGFLDYFKLTDEEILVPKPPPKDLVPSSSYYWAANLLGREDDSCYRDPKFQKLYPLFKDPRWTDGTFKKKGVCMYTPKGYRPLNMEDLKKDSTYVSTFSANLVNLFRAHPSDVYYLGLTDPIYYGTLDGRTKLSKKYKYVVTFDEIKEVYGADDAQKLGGTILYLRFKDDLAHEEEYRKSRGTFSSTIAGIVSHAFAITAGLAAGAVIMKIFFAFFEASGGDTENIKKFQQESGSKYHNRITRIRNRQRPTLVAQCKKCKNDDCDCDDCEDFLAEGLDSAADSVAMRVWRNSYFAEFIYADDSKAYGNALFVHGNILVANYHFFTPKSPLQLINLYSERRNKWDKVPIKIDNTLIKHHIKRDLTFLLVPLVDSHRSLYQRHMRSKDDINLHGIEGITKVDSTIADDTELCLFDRSSGPAKHFPEAHVENPFTKEKHWTGSVTMVKGCAHEPGDCGIGYVIHNTAVQKKFIGIHGGGTRENSIVCNLYKEDVDDFLAFIKQNGDSFTKMIVETEIDEIPVMEGLSSNDNVSGTRWGLKLQAELSHSFTYPIKTNLVQTPIATGALDRSSGKYLAPPFEMTQAPACLDRKAEELSMRQLKNRTRKLEPIHLDSFLGVEKTLSDCEGRILSIYEAVKGIPEWNNFHSMERSTSSSYPYQKLQKKKRDLILYSYEELEKRQDKLDFIPVFHPQQQKVDYSQHDLWIHKHVVESVNDIISKGRRGIIVPHMTLFCLKDEPRPLEKVKDKYTRAFQMGSLAYLIASRMTYGELAHLTEKTREGDIQVGVNPFSADWKDLLTQLQAKGCTYHALDKKGWDLRFAVRKFLPAFWKWLEHMGLWNKEDKQLMWCMMYASLHPFVVIRNKVYSGQFMPSGCWKTSFVNSWLNSIEFREAFRHICPGLDFDEFIRLLTFGDDSLDSSKAEVATKFTGPAIAEYTFEHFDHECTTSTKSGSIADFEIQDQVNFLQRKFVEVDGVVLAPLSKESIETCLQWIMKPKVGTTFAEQFRINCHAMCDESARHGEQYFEKIKATCNAFLRTSNPAFQYKETYQNARMRVVHDSLDQ